jgi:DNA-binding transcriptional LysR family regulator
MELHQLRYFCAVADTGSFSRAAEHSHVSQPSLSQQILKLEAELGARLFDRLGRSVRLTDVGKAFLPRALSVLRELEAARGDVVESKESVSGQVAVGVIPTVAPYFLPPVLAAFAKLFPKSTVTVVEEITPVLLERLRAGSIDIAILALPVRGHEFEALPLITEPLLAALPKIIAFREIGPSRSANFAKSLSFYCVMAIVSAKTPSPPAIVRASRRRSFSRADNFPAYSAWSALGLAFRWSPLWPSIAVRRSASYASRILPRLAPLAH